MSQIKFQGKKYNKNFLYVFIFIALFINNISFAKKETLINDNRQQIIMQPQETMTRNSTLDNTDHIESVLEKDKENRKKHKSEFKEQNFPKLSLVTENGKKLSTDTIENKEQNRKIEKLTDQTKTNEIINEITKLLNEKEQSDSKLIVILNTYSDKTTKLSNEKKREYENTILKIIEKTDKLLADLQAKKNNEEKNETQKKKPTNKIAIKDDKDPYSISIYNDIVKKAQNYLNNLKSEEISKLYKKFNTPNNSNSNSNSYNWHEGNTIDFQNATNIAEEENKEIAFLTEKLKKDFITLKSNFSNIYFQNIEEQLKTFLDPQINQLKKMKDKLTFAYKNFNLLNAKKNENPKTKNSFLDRLSKFLNNLTISNNNKQKKKLEQEKTINNKIITTLNSQINRLSLDNMKKEKINNIIQQKTHLLKLLPGLEKIIDPNYNIYNSITPKKNNKNIK